MGLYGDPTTDYDDWENPLAGTSRDPEKVYYDYYPRKVKTTSMFWLYVQESNAFFIGTAIVFGLFTAVGILCVIVTLNPAVNYAGGIILSVFLSVPTMLVIGTITIIIGNIISWYKKRPAKKKWEREYRMNMLIKEVDNALARYEKLSPKPIEKEPYEYAYLPAGVPIPRVGGGVPRF